MQLINRDKTERAPCPYPICLHSSPISDILGEIALILIKADQELHYYIFAQGKTIDQIMKWDLCCSTKQGFLCCFVAVFAGQMYLKEGAKKGPCISFTTTQLGSKKTPPKRPAAQLTNLLFCSFQMTNNTSAEQGSDGFQLLFKACFGFIRSDYTLI